MKKWITILITLIASQSFASGNYSEIAVSLKECRQIFTPTSVGYLTESFVRGSKYMECQKFDDLMICTVIENGKQFNKMYISKNVNSFEEIADSKNIESYLLKDRAVIYNKKVINPDFIFNEVCQGVSTTTEQRENMRYYDVSDGIKAISLSIEGI